MAKKTVLDIAEDFSFRRAKIDGENERRQKNDAEINELEQKKRALLLKKLERAFSAENFAEADAEIARITAQQERIVCERGLRVEYACEKCSDTGIVNGHYCNCFLREVYTNLYGAEDISRITGCFEDADMSVFDEKNVLSMGKTQRELANMTYKICKSYMADFPATIRLNVLLRGKAGLGKTYLMNSMARAARERGIDVCLVRAGALFNAFFRHRMGDDIPMSFLENAELLMIDDLGTEPMTQNVTIEYLFGIINCRLENKKHTVFATNVNDLQTRYGERISSRLESCECAEMILDGADLRRRK
ncbi:MAG: ATP-binding protein [Christensenella sp.]